MNVAKSFQISKRVVWEAYLQVKSNKGSPGYDNEGVEVFEVDLKNNLYKLWRGSRCYSLEHIYFRSKR